MTRVMVVSNNILADTTVQRDLQKLNYEVLVSSSIYEHLVYQLPVSDLLQSFPIILLSETLTKEEINKVLPSLILAEKQVIQRVYAPLDNEEKEYWKNQGIAGWSIVTDPLIELKKEIERLHTKVNTLFQENVEEIDNESKISILPTISFTPKEVHVLKILYFCKGKIVTKEEICERIWQQKLTLSRKTQIYAIIGNLKDKISGLKPNKVFIGAQHGNGYYLTKDFYDTFVLEESFFSNGTLTKSPDVIVHSY